MRAGRGINQFERNTATVAVKIRLKRVGKKKQPTYRVVVADGRSPRDGRFIEIIGQYAPRQDPSYVSIDADLALAWLHKGAQPSVTVQKLLAEVGVWERFESEKGKKVKVAAPKPVRTKPVAEPPTAANDEGPETSDDQASTDATEES